MAKITKRSVDAVKPAPGRDVLLWDDELSGFGLRCRPSGAKTYVLKYRTTGGRQRWLTLGAHGPLTPERARAKALHEKAAIGDGDDPSGDRQKKRHEATVAAVADRYLAEYVAAHNKASTAAEVRRIVDTRIKPRLGAVKVSDLTSTDIKAWHQSMHATPYEANRALAYCSRMLTLAATDWGLREGNPCTGIKRFPERKRERFFSDAELARIGDALAAAERDGAEAPGFILLVRLLATTGMRLGEALGLEWARPLPPPARRQGGRPNRASRRRGSNDPRRHRGPDRLSRTRARRAPADIRPERGTGMGATARARRHPRRPAARSATHGRHLRRARRRQRVRGARSSWPPYPRDDRAFC
jgi:integrase